MTFIDILPFIAVGAFLLGLVLLRLLLRVRVGGAPMTMPEVVATRSGSGDAAPMSQELQTADVLDVPDPGTVPTPMTMDPPVILDTPPEGLIATADWEVGHATITSALDLGEGLGGTRLYDLRLEVETGGGMRSSVEHVALVPH